MKRNSILILILLISVMIVSLPGISEALPLGLSDYTGYRTADPADTDHYGIYATGEWGDGTANGYFEISWVIDADQSYPKLYKYEYTFNIPITGGGLSHFIIEVSENATRNNFIIIDPNNELTSDLNLHEEGQGNPNIPAPLYGIKIETPGDDGLQTYTIYSDRAPMWGDLYAKDGKDTIAYNMGFGEEPTPYPGDNPFKRWIAVPDTLVPEPGTTILMILGMMGLVGIGIKRKLHK